jgi:cytochrome c oxidase assembly factor CtaG
MLALLSGFEVVAILAVILLLFGQRYLALSEVEFRRHYWPLVLSILFLVGCGTLAANFSF